jgi:DNA-binding CsgD family transcriptional regulator
MWEPFSDHREAPGEGSPSARAKLADRVEETLDPKAPGARRSVSTTQGRLSVGCGFARGSCSRIGTAVDSAVLAVREDCDEWADLRHGAEPRSDRASADARSAFSSAPVVTVQNVREDGWSELFWAAFTQSRNPMVLLDDPRLVVDVNGAFLALTGDKRDDVIGRAASSLVVGGPVLSPEEWATRLALGHFTGETELRCAGGDSVVVQWGADVEIVTGRRLILLVALSMSRWGRHHRRGVPSAPPRGKLSEREREIVRLVAQGRSGPEIADDLNISPDTVRTHVRNAMSKMGARSRAHLVAKVLGEGVAL